MSKRAERRHHIARVAKARRDLTKTMLPWAGWPHRSDNALATRHPLDCGKRCLLCHGEKLLGAGSRRAREKREAMRDE